MFGLTTSLAVTILTGLGLVALAIALWIAFRIRRHKRRQASLSRGFERAQKASKTGSGIQGKPYSVYGEPSWSDKAGSNGH